MMGNTTVSNWKLLCSDDGVHWQTVHIATDQTAWENTPRRFDLSGISQLPCSALVRGRVALFGSLARLLDVFGDFRAVTKTIGYGRFEGLVVFGQFAAAIPQPVRGTGDRYLLPLTSEVRGKVGIGGHLRGNLRYLALESTNNQLFLGRVALRATLLGAVSHLQTAITGAIRIPITAWLNFDLAPARFVASGGASNRGSANLALDDIRSRWVASNTRFLIPLRLAPLTAAIRLRTTVRGSMAGWLESNARLTFRGIVPQPTYITGRMMTETVRWFMRALVPVRVQLNLVTDWPTSRRTFAVTFTGIMTVATAPATLVGFGKRGPPIIFSGQWVTASPIGQFVGRGMVLGRVQPTTLSLKTTVVGLVPSRIYGELESQLRSDESAIRIKNWKWAKADEVRWNMAPVQSSAKGLILIGGKLKSTPVGMLPTQVYSQIYAVVPLAIRAVAHPVLAPVYSPGSVRGWVKVYGHVRLSLAAVTARRFIGNVNVGQLKTTLDALSALIRLRTVIHAIGILRVFDKDLFMEFNAYGRIANRGRIVISVPSELKTVFQLHTPIVPSPCYGSFITTFSSLQPTLWLQQRLIHGKINTTLDPVSTSLKIFYICRGTLGALLRSVKVEINFKIYHFVGRWASVTDIPVGDFRLHSRVLARMHIKLSSFQLRLETKTRPVFRGHMPLDIMAYQGSYIKEYNGGVFSDISAIYYRLIYGRLEISTKSIQYTQITGVVPRAILGLFLAKLGWDYSRWDAKTPPMGRMHTTTGLDAIKRTDIRGSHSVGRLRFQTGLDPVNNVFLGIAAHPIMGVLQPKLLNERTSDRHGWIYPLQVAIRGRVKIYGSLRAPVAPIEFVYFRGGNAITGTWIGGDQQPVWSCYAPSNITGPCREELESRINRSIDERDKIYWTLKWVRGHFQAIHRFPIIGRLYSPNIEYTLGYYAGTNHGFGDFKGIVPFKGSMDVFISSYTEYQKGMLVYGQFTGFTVSGPFNSMLRDLRSQIEVNVQGRKVGRLATDLGTVNGKMGGFTTVKGGAGVKLEPTRAAWGGKVPIPYKTQFAPRLDTLVLRMELYTPFQNFGVLINPYLNDLTVTGALRGWIRATGHLRLTTPESIKQSDFYVRLTHVLGTFIPNARLERCLVQILGKTPLPNENPGFIRGWFLAKIPSTLTGQFQLRANIYQNVALRTAPATSTIFMRTPIRIWTYWHPALVPVTGIVTAIAYPTAHLRWKLDDARAQLTFIYYQRKTVALTVATEPLQPAIIGRVPVHGAWVQTLQPIQFQFPTFHFTFGWMSLHTTLTATWAGTHFLPSLYLPKEAVYTVGGRVENTLQVKRAYFVSLFDRKTSERIQALPANPTQPFDYTFGSVIPGRYFVLCKPAQTVVGSRVRTVVVDLEEEDRFQ